MLGSQTTYRNDLILCGKALSSGFQKVQNHFCGWSVSWAICDQTRSILSWHNDINCYKIYWVWSRIAQLTDHPQKQFCTFWNPEENAFYWAFNHFCRLSVSRAIQKLRSGLRMSLNLKNNEFHHNKKHINWGAARFYYTFLGLALSIFSYGKRFIKVAFKTKCPDLR